jgi:hypothetical protein
LRRRINKIRALVLSEISPEQTEAIRADLEDAKAERAEVRAPVSMEKTEA